MVTPEQVWAQRCLAYHQKVAPWSVDPPIDTHLFRRPLEARDNWIFDLVQILHSFCAIDQDVGTSGVGTKTPDLSHLVHIKLVRLRQITCASFRLIFRRHFTLEKLLTLVRAAARVILNLISSYGYVSCRWFLGAINIISIQSRHHKSARVQSTRKKLDCITYK